MTTFTTLYPGQTMYGGDELVSSNGQYRARLLTTGDLIMLAPNGFNYWRASNDSEWSASTSRIGPSTVSIREPRVIISCFPPTRTVCLGKVGSSYDTWYPDTDTTMNYLYVNDSNGFLTANVTSPSGFTFEAVFSGSYVGGTPPATESTGIAIYNSVGEEYFSTASATWSFLGSFIAPASASATFSIPEISLVSEVLLQRTFVDSPPGNQEAFIHTASVSGTNVVAINGNVRTLITVLGR